MNNKKTPGKPPARGTASGIELTPWALVSPPPWALVSLTPWALVCMDIKCGELSATLEELKTKIDELKAGIVEIARPVEAETEAKK